MADLAKLVEELSALSVLEAAELKTLLEDKWGVKASSGGGGAMMMAAAPVAAEPVEEQTEFTVTLKDGGPKKINVIKVVRAITSLGLKEAKDLVEGAPQVIKEGVTKEEAADIKAKLEAESAVVEVK
ncbi:MAG: 50S ribosomal protein L7/L12 [Phototrophicales bacterium]|nr:50S ribosomal protein L7/L12 [Phototrophicales bacterium]